MSIPEDMLVAARDVVEHTHQQRLPFHCRGIRIDEDLIAATLEILNAEPNKTLPQQSVNAAKAKNGLDLRLKQQLDLRRANIISDLLAHAEIVSVIPVTDIDTDRTIKGTKLNVEWTW